MAIVLGLGPVTGTVNVNVSGQVTIAVPALDRLLDFLEGKQQKEIDQLSKMLEDLNDQLAKSSERLEASEKAHE